MKAYRMLTTAKRGIRAPGRAGTTLEQRTTLAALSNDHVPQELLPKLPPQRVKQRMGLDAKSHSIALIGPERYLAKKDGSERCSFMTKR